MEATHAPRMRSVMARTGTESLHAGALRTLRSAQAPSQVGNVALSFDPAAECDGSAIIVATAVANRTTSLPPLLASSAFTAHFGPRTDPRLLGNS